MMQIKPGDDCTIHLAGIHAFTGKVMTRQVYFDADRHHVEIIAGTNHELATGSVVHPGMEWTNKTYPQIAADVLKRFGVNLKFEGGSPPSERMKRVSAMHGESAIDFLEVLARGQGGSDMANAITSNANGDLVIIRGPSGGTDTLTEGKEILIGREVVYQPAALDSRPAVGQELPTDQKWGAAANQGFADLGGQMDFSGKQPSAVTMLEFPATKAFLENRSGNEGGFLTIDQITATITVQGWLRPSGGLWQRNQQVKVISPSLMLKGDEDLRLKSVTFSQDNHSGTRSTLVLCNPAASKTRPGIT